MVDKVTHRGKREVIVSRVLAREGREALRINGEVCGVGWMGMRGAERKGEVKRGCEWGVKHGLMRIAEVKADGREGCEWRMGTWMKVYMMRGQALGGVEEDASGKHRRGEETDHRSTMLTCTL